MSFVKDFVSDTLNGAITNVATTATLNSAADFPAPLGPSVPYYFCGIFDGGTYSSPEAAFVAGDMETVLVTGLSGAVLTIERGFGRTTGVAHGDGDTVVMLADAQNIGESWAINVRSYGATGDGTTDDGPEFEKALVNSQQLGLALYVPQGDYKLTTFTDGLDSIAETTIIGEGHRSIIRGASQSVRFMDMKNTHPLFVRDVRFHTWDMICNLNDLLTTQIVPSVILRNCMTTDVNTLIGWKTTKPLGATLTYGEISGCDIDRPDDQIVEIIGDIDRFVFRDNVVRDANATSEDTLFTIGRGTQSEQDGWKDILIDGNHFVNNTISSAIITELIVVHGLKCAITNNIIDGTTASGTTAISISARARYATITSNVINDTASSAYGITVLGDQRGDTSSVNSYGNVVNGNTIRLSNGVAGIYVVAEETVVSNNYVEDADFGVLIGDFTNGPWDQISVIGNVLKRTSAAAGSSGVYVRDVGEAMVIQGNSITSFANGIDIDVGGRAQTCNGMSIAGNMITDFSSTGIRIDAGTSTSSLDRISVVNNSIYTASGSTTALVTDGVAGTNLRRMCIQGNVWNASTLVTYTKQPTFATYCQHLNDATPNSNIIAEIGTLAVSNVAGTAALHLKETGDHTNAGWKLVTIT